MNRTLSIAIALASMASASGAMAEVDVYGKANVSFELVEEGDASTTELVSNASRLGFKGSETINESLEAIYQLEYEIYIDDADTFKQRNIFVGLRGGYGQVIVGHFDTLLKAAQRKVDLFNDLRGDIKYVVSPHENRAGNTIQYTTPDVLGGFQAAVALMSSEVEDVDDGKSAALAWANEHFYIAGAMEQDVEFQGAEAMRLVAQYNRGGLQLGALYEQTDADFLDDSVAAYMVSAQYKVNDWAFKVQHGASDAYLDIDYLELTGTPFAFENGETTSVGADYKLSKTAKLFGFYTVESADEDAFGNDVLDNSYAGIGMELKF